MQVLSLPRSQAGGRVCIALSGVILGLAQVETPGPGGLVCFPAPVPGGCSFIVKQLIIWHLWCTYK